MKVRTDVEPRRSKDWRTIKDSFLWNRMNTSNSALDNYCPILHWKVAWDGGGGRGALAVAVVLWLFLHLLHSIALNPALTSLLCWSYKMYQFSCKYTWRVVLCNITFNYVWFLIFLCTPLSTSCIQLSWASHPSYHSTLGAKILMGRDIKKISVQFYVFTSSSALMWLILKPSNCSDENLKKSVQLYTDLLSAITTLLKAYSHAYILITLIPVMISFITLIRWSVSRADLNLWICNAMDECMSEVHT